MENDPMLNTTYGSTGNNDTLRPISVSLADMLKVLAEHVMDFNQLLIEPRSVVGIELYNRSSYTHHSLLFVP